MFKISKCIGNIGIVFFTLTIISSPIMAKDLTIDPPKCNQSNGTAYVQRGKNQAEFKALGAGDPASFVEAMVKISGCYSIVSSPDKAQYLITAMPITKSIFEGTSNDDGELDIAGELTGALSGFLSGKMRYGAIEIRDRKSGSAVGSGRGRNNQSKISYANWGFDAAGQSADSAFNSSKNAKLVGGAIVNSYFDLLKSGSTSSGSVASSGQARSQEKISVSGSKGYMILGYDSNRYGNNVGYIDVTEDHPNLMPRAVFSVDEPNLSKAKQILAKFDKWVATSKTNDIRSVQKPLASLTYNVMIGLGLDSMREGKRVHPSPITNKFVFVADAKGSYKLDVSVFSGRCGEGDICSRRGDAGATLSVEEVSDLRALLNDINSLKAQKSKADLLQ